MKKINLFLTLALTITIGSMNANSISDQIQYWKQKFLENPQFRNGIESIERSHQINCSEKLIECLDLKQEMYDEGYLSLPDLSYLTYIKNKLQKLITEQQKQQSK